MSIDRDEETDETDGDDILKLLQTYTRWTIA